MSSCLKLVVVGTVALGFGAGCGDEPVREGPARVTVSDSGYEPAELKIRVGEHVTFVNRGKESHTAKDDPRGEIDVSPRPGPTNHDGGEVARATRAGFATHSLFPYEAQRVVFPVARKYAYHCAFHEGMTGTIEVVE